MLVRFLKATPYTPTKADSLRCYGQLRLRSTQVSREVDVEVAKPDGTTETIKTTQTSCGPMEHFFPKGATPDLDAGTAAAFIAAGAAEPFEEPSAARFISSREEMDALLNDIKED